MSDELLTFDTRQIRKDVADLEQGLDNLTKKVANLDKVGVRTLESELKKLSNNGAAALKELANRGELEAKRLSEAFGTGKGGFAWVNDVKQAQSALASTLQEMTNRIRMYHADRMLSEEKASKAMVANATQEAKDVGRAFTNLKTLTSNLTQARLREAQAQARADKQILQDSLAERANLLTQDAARTRQLMANFSQQFGFDRAVITKSAKDSAAVFSEAFALEAGRAAQGFNNFEKMLGIDRSKVSKSAKDSASVFQQAFADEAVRGRDTISTFERMMGLDKNRVAKSAKDSAAVFNSVFNANIGTTGQRLGGSEVVGAYSAYDAIRVKPVEVDKLSNSFKRLTIEGNDVHSMARGLASGFNLLWLTWGNLAPLFAGASISFGLKKTFDIGSEVEYLIKFMETLGQTTDSTGKVMQGAGSIIRQELRNIDQTTQFSLVELSQAMVRLGQAGQSPKEALMTLRPAADLASVGMTDLSTATDLLIQTQALFGKSTADMGMMAAQIFKITKSGVLNVQDIAGSMKYASEANTRFGKSLEETLTLLGALAQAGLKGSSGGTALINFYRDLNGRSGPAVKALKDLEKATGTTIEVFDKFGKQRSGIDIFNDIASASDRLKAKDADKLLAKIFSDRGGRTFFAMVRDGTINLREMMEQLEKTKPSELFDAAKGLMDTTKGAMNILQGSLVGALDQVFEAYSKEFKGFITDVNSMIDSDGFKLSVASMVETVKTLYNVIKDFGPTLVTFFGIWAGWKVVSTGVAIVGALATGLAALAPVLSMSTGAFVRQTLSVETNSMALISNVAASRAAAVGATELAAAQAGAAAASTTMAARAGVAGLAMRGLTAAIGILANPIVGLVLTIGTLAGAFWSMSGSAKDSMMEATGSILQNGKLNLAQWDKEIGRLRTRNALLSAGAYGSTEAQLRTAQDNLVFMEAEERLLRQNLGKGRGTLAGDVQYPKDVARINQLVTDRVAQQRLLNQAKTDLSKLQAEERNRQIDEQLKAQRNIKTGQGDISITPTAGSPFGKKYVEGLKVAGDNSIAQIEKNLSMELSALRQHADNVNKINDARHQNGVITEGQYQAETFRLTREYEKNALAEIDNATVLYAEAYQRRKTALEEALGKAETAKRADDVSRLKQELENLSTAQDTFNNKTTADRNKIVSDSYTRMELAIIKTQGTLKKLSDEEQKYWKDDQAEYDKARAVMAVNDQYQYLNESVFSLDVAAKAGAEASAAATAKHESHVKDLTVRYEQAADAANVFMLANIAALASGDEETTQRYNQLRELQLQIENAIKDTQTKGANSSAEAYKIAFERVRKDQAEKFTNDLSGAIVTGLFEGGKAGKDGLRRILIEELKKPVTMVVNVAVNALLQGIFGQGGGILGDLLNAGSGGAGGGGGFGSLLSLGSNAMSGYSMMTNFAGTIGKYVTTLFGQTAGNTATGMALGLGSSSSAAAANGAAAAGGATGGGAASGLSFGSIGPAAYAAIAVGLFMNAIGAFRSEKRVGAGIAGTLGSGDIENYELWRTGGTLFSGPKYKNKNPAKEIEAYEADIKRLREAGQGNTEAVYEMEAQVRYLKEVYGESIEAAKKQSKILQDAYEGMRTNVGDMADSLGLSSEAVRKFTMNIGTDLIHPDTGGYGLSFTDLSNEEIAAKIEEALKTANNTLAEQVIGTWKTVTETIRTTVQTGTQTNNDTDYIPATFREDVETVTRLVYVQSEYAREGEKAIDTLTRLATSIVAVNGVFEQLGVTLYDASLAGGDMASQLIDLFGGLENFLATTKSYYDLYYKPDEKVAMQTQTLTKEFDKLGFKLPKTRDEFRKLVESQDLTTEAGRKMYASLLALASPFSQFLDALKALEDQAKETGDVVEETIAQWDPALLLDAQRQARETALAALEAAISAERELLDVRRAGYEAQVNTLKSLFDMLDRNIKELYASVASTSTVNARAGRATITSAALLARTGGVLPKSEDLSAAIDAVRASMTEESYASQFDMDRDRLRLASELLTIQNATGKQLTTAEQQLEAANAAIKKLDQTLDYWRKQIAIAEGTYKETTTVASAIENLTKLLFPTANKPNTPVFGPSTPNAPSFGGSSNPGGGSPNGPGNVAAPPKYRQVFWAGGSEAGYEPVIDPARIAWLDILSPIYHAFDGTGDLKGLLTAIKGAGGTLMDLSTLSGFYLKDWVKASESVGIPAFAKGGRHFGGARIVGERGPELEVTDSSFIYNSAQTARLLSGGGTGGDSEAMVSSMSTLFNRQMAEQRAQFGAMVRTQMETLKLLKRWDNQGMPEERDVETTTQTP